MLKHKGIDFEGIDTPMPMIKHLPPPLPLPLLPGVKESQEFAKVGYAGSTNCQVERRPWGSV